MLTSDSNDQMYSIEILKEYAFVDSVNLGNHILAIRSQPYQHKLYVHLYTKSSKGLIRFEAFDSLDTQFGDTNPIFEDFNNDALMDFKIRAGTGARGSNELFYLFIQNGKENFIRIKGAEEKPNLQYDSVNHTLTSTAYWAGTSFIDYVIKGDTLVPVKGVDVYLDSPKRTIHKHYKFSDKGNEILVGIDSVEDDGAGLYSRN